MSGQRPSRSTSTPTGPVVLFDGVCNLCHGTVRWILARDRERRFRFASLQSEAARRLLAERDFGPVTLDSLLLVEETRVAARSDAVLAIAAALPWPWSMGRFARWVPRVLRDGLYRWVAGRRYRWFGRSEGCLLPTPELVSRFLDRDEPVVDYSASEPPP